MEGGRGVEGFFGGGLVINIYIWEIFNILGYN
jgi:hypothetical protein